MPAARFMHPRPSSIVAALYTARDLEVDVAILHGPSGCSFKHARLLEEDGMRVLTTALADNEFIFGGQKPLEGVLQVRGSAFLSKAYSRNRNLRFHDHRGGSCIGYRERGDH